MELFSGMDNQAFVARLNTIKTLNSDNCSFVNKGLYRLVTSQPALIASYVRVRNNKGTAIPRTDNGFLDDSHLRKVTTLQQTLLDESWQPVVKKAKIPLDTTNTEERTVQDVVSTVLEAVYEPVFSDQSFGSRPNKNEHDALKDIESKYDGLSYVVIGQLENIYNNIDHRILVNLLGKKIADSRFISLIWKLLRGGYVDEKGCYISKLGLYKNSVLSPILVNIYLHELDTLMKEFQSLETVRSKTLTPVAKQYKNKVKVLTNKANKLDKGLERDETLKQLKATKLQRIQCRTYVDPHSRVYFHRYMNNFLVGIAGSKEYALEINESVRAKCTANACKPKAKLLVCKH